MVPFKGEKASMLEKDNLLTNTNEVERGELLRTYCAVMR